MHPVRWWWLGRKTSGLAWATRQLRAGPGLHAAGIPADRAVHKAQSELDVGQMGQGQVLCGGSGRRAVVPVDPQKRHARDLRGELSKRLDCRLVLQNDLGAWQFLPTEQHRACAKTYPASTKTATRSMDLRGEKGRGSEGAPVVTAPFIAYSGRPLQNTALEACQQADDAV
jgi:hypothetical protein